MFEGPENKPPRTPGDSDGFEKKGLAEKGICMLLKTSG